MVWNQNFHMNLSFYYYQNFSINGLRWFTCHHPNGFLIQRWWWSLLDRTVARQRCTQVWPPFRLACSQRKGHDWNYGIWKRTKMVKREKYRRENVGKYLQRFLGRKGCALFTALQLSSHNRSSRQSYFATCPSVPVQST